MMRRLVLPQLGLVAVVWAAPAVSKVEPPNWRVPHTRNPVQLLLTGSDLNGVALHSESPALRVTVKQASADGRYLFAYVTVDTAAAPGRYRFRVTKGSNETAFDWRLDAPLDPDGRFQGFTPDDVIYLLMPDRFANSDPSNDSPAGLGRPADRNAVNAYHGGDLKGIREHLAYLKDLGVTGIWMTPVYKNSNPAASPYHGYHTVDFYDSEPRFGSLTEFAALVDAAHLLGMKVVQDQVANHSGPDHPWVKNPPAPQWFHDLERMPRLRNNFDIAALADPYARPSARDLPLRGWFAGHLPDFDQENPLLSDYLIQNALWWIGETGIDAIRQDTYPYADRPFWEAWQTAIDRQYPDLVVTGEITAPTPAVLSFFQGGARHNGIDTRLKSMLDFPLQRAIRAVFARGEPMTGVAGVLAQDFLYLHPELLVAFIGNHDGPRFLTEAGGDIGKLMMAQAFVLTTRRVPHLYYGDEIAMGAGADRTDRSIRADFPGGFPGDPLNAFTPQGRTGDAARVFGFMRDLLHFRLEHPALRRGLLMQLLANKDQYVYGRSTRDERVLIVLNRGGKAFDVDLRDLNPPEGMRMESWIKGEAGVTVSGGKFAIPEGKEIGIYWASAR